MPLSQATKYIVTHRINQFLKSLKVDPSGKERATVVLTMAHWYLLGDMREPFLTKDTALNDQVNGFAAVRKNPSALLREFHFAASCVDDSTLIQAIQRFIDTTIQIILHANQGNERTVLEVSLFKCFFSTPPYVKEVDWQVQGAEYLDSLHQLFGQTGYHPDRILYANRIAEGYIGFAIAQTFKTRLLHSYIDLLEKIYSRQDDDIDGKHVVLQALTFRKRSHRIAPGSANEELWRFGNYILNHPDALLRKRYLALLTKLCDEGIEYQKSIAFLFLDVDRQGYSQGHYLAHQQDESAMVTYLQLMKRLLANNIISATQVANIFVSKQQEMRSLANLIHTKCRFQTVYDLLPSLLPGQTTNRLSLCGAVSSTFLGKRKVEWATFEADGAFVEERAKCGKS